LNDKPKLLLFISIDIAGSTAYKNSTLGDGSEVHPWLPVLYYFFSEFPITFSKINEQNKDRIKPTCFTQPKVWKHLGDEIIFVVELRHFYHLGYYLTNAREAMDTFVLDSLKDKSLGLKGTAWIAGFPVANVEVNIPTPDGSLIDYLGRSMDAGFRLSKLATPQKFILSIQTAWMLAMESADIEIYYDGRANLKGIKNGGQYPIFWISSDKNHATELDLLKIKPSESRSITAFCQHYISDNGLGLPFIEHDDKFSRYKESGYDDKLAKVLSLLEKNQIGNDVADSPPESEMLRDELISAAKDQSSP